jgi:glycosyltransferase involved in cell wall biosynthesis
MNFSLVIPCFNESKSLPELFEKCRKLYEINSIELIFVNNGSTDDSGEIFKHYKEIYPNIKIVEVDKNQGYGFGILSGLQQATGDIIGWTHADLQTDPMDVLKAVKLFEEYGMNIFVKGLRKARPITDEIFTFAMSIFETCLLKTFLRDINAQPSMFSKKFFEQWSSPPYDFSLDLYAYYQAKKNKLPVHRFSVEFPRRQHGASHWNVDWASKYKFIKRTILFSLNLRKVINL